MVFLRDSVERKEEFQKEELSLKAEMLEFEKQKQKKSMKSWTLEKNS